MASVTLLGMISPIYIIIILIVALLIFGKNLPQVGRNLGRGIVEFKKGLSGIEDDLNQPNGSGSGNAPPEPPKPLPKAPEFHDAPKSS
jgi:sec-independent protein translocase protein TatA